MKDLDEELDLLGYGNSWDEQVGKLAAKKQANDDKRLGALLEYKASSISRAAEEQAREKTSKRVRRLRARQLERWIEMMGETCHKCNRKFNQTDSRAQRCTSKECR